MEKGTLKSRIIRTTERALAAGALLPIPTNYTFVEEQGVRYFVRVLESLKRKDEERKKQDASASGTKTDPFLPPEPELAVGEVSAGHIAVLNKFSVMEQHLLIVTRHFEDQDSLLTPGDFEALWFCMAEYDSLGFYNGGQEAGASQNHKHLQVVPLPLAPEGPAIPVEPFFALAPFSPGPCLVPGFPFLHSFSRLDKRLAASPADAARETFGLYSAMLRHAGMQPADASRLTKQSMPYCLLVTREWMLLVPRSKEFVEGISFNSLAFAGSFFVRDTGQLHRLTRYGVMNALKAAAIGI